MAKADSTAFWDVGTATKQCTKCKETKPITCFSYHRTRKRGRPLYDSVCKPCRCHGERERRKAKPMAHRPYHLRVKYGISVAKYEEMYADQAGVCAICGRPERRHRLGRTRLLAVDHDHGTGAIRSLLCQDCNAMIGQAGDDPKRLRAGAEYLERWSSHGQDKVPEV